MNCAFAERGKKGIAYLSVLILVLVITVSGLAFLQLSELEDRLFSEESRSYRGLAAAEGGIRRAAWALRGLPALQALNPGSRLNPFHPQWYTDPANPLEDTDLMDLVNPRAGETFHPDSRGEYYWITSLTGAGTKVRLRLLGSVDVDGDGMGGLGDRDTDGYPELADADPQDTNRFLEGYLGLPGSLGQDLAAAAQDVVDAAGAPVAFNWGTWPFKSAKNQELGGVWYETVVGSYHYGTVISKLLLKGGGGGSDISPPVLLPRGLFGADGRPDPAYFAGLPMRIYDGNQTFDPSNDPTSGTSAGTIILVNGDIVVRDVDFGFLSSGGTLTGSDWTRPDVVLVATGKITTQDVSCGWAGRLVLVAKEIELIGTWGRWMNALVLASNDVTLSSSLPSSQQWVYIFQNDKPVLRANYLFGSVVAGGKIRLASKGWSVIFDRLVLNGVMGQLFPTRLLDRLEGEGLGPCWVVSGEVTQAAQGRYLQDEVDSRAGDSQDLGVDGVPELLRTTVSPTTADTGEGEGVRLVLDGSVAGCEQIQKDWSQYTALLFHMAMDNYRRVQDLGGGVVLTTEREARFRLVLRDSASPANELEYHLNLDDDPSATREKYLSDQWGTAPYVLSGGDVQDPDPSQDDYASGRLPRWKRIDLSFTALTDPSGAVPSAFDFQDVREINFLMRDLTLRWRRESGGVTSVREVKSAGGKLIYDPDGGGPLAMEITKAADGRLQYQDPISGADLDVPCDAGGDCWGVGPIFEGDLVTSLRLDRLVLPGGAMMDHGLPPCFSLEVSRWREIPEQEAMR